MDTAESLTDADVTRNWARLFLFYGVPITAIILTAWLKSVSGKTLIFVSAFSVMGIASVRNTRKCGRVHWSLVLVGCSGSRGAWDGGNPAWQ